MIRCFSEKSFSRRVMKGSISAKLLYIETQIAPFPRISEKLLLFETEIVTFVRISKKLLLFTESTTFPEKSTNVLLLV